MRVVYVSGEYLPENEAKVSVFDRGFLFGDAVYEVTSVLEGKLIDFPAHIARLRRSLAELEMPFNLSDEQLLDIHRSLVNRNNLIEGGVYLQVTRGAADRNFQFPDEGTPNNVVLFTQAKSLREGPSIEQGIKVITIDDLRWRRCDIKTTQLLYPSIAKTQAVKQGADDAWLVKDGFITEGTSNNAYIVTAEGEIITRPRTNEILHGITRASVLACAESLQLKVIERPFSIEEAEQAAEAFITSAGAFVTGVVKINDSDIGDGKPGKVTSKLREIYLEKSLESAI